MIADNAENRQERTVFEAPAETKSVVGSPAVKLPPVTTVVSTDCLDRNNSLGQDHTLCFTEIPPQRFPAWAVPKKPRLSFLSDYFYCCPAPFPSLHKLTSASLTPLKEFH